MTAHYLRFVLPEYILHKNADNLRVHVLASAVLWLAIATLLSRFPVRIAVPLLGANAGAIFVVLSGLYWLPVDALSSACVVVGTAAWARLPFTSWGPLHHSALGFAGPIASAVVAATTMHLAHVYYHEHAAFLRRARGAWLVAAHALLWGAFHYTFLALLRAGWRPRTGERLDEDERRALSGLENVPWFNWARTVSCKPARVSVPRTVDELVLAVKEAHARGDRVRVVASGFSWTSLVPTDETLVFCERLDGVTVDTSDADRPTVWAEAGVTNRRLNHELARHGLCMPCNVVLETVRVAGIVSTGTHGTGKHTATLGDLAVAFEVIDAEGNLRVLSEETVGGEVMSAVRLGLGLFGVIARVRLRVVPLYRVRQVDLRVPAQDVLGRIDELIKAHDSVELYWFPFQPDVWVRTIDRTLAPRTFHGHGFGFRAQNFLQNAWLIALSSFIIRFAPWLTPALLRAGIRLLPFRARVLDLPESHHYHHWIEMMRCGCMEVGFKTGPDASHVVRAWHATERLVDAYAKRGLYPLNLSLNVRFTGSSKALLTPAHGEGLTCYIEIMWRGRPRGWVEFTSELCREWLKVPGALPHWSKEFEHVEDIFPLVRAGLGDRRRRFLAALEASGIDPDRRFFNGLTRRMLLDEAS